MEIMNALKLIEDLETSLASMYAHLTKRFSEDREVEQFFDSLQMDENSHAELVRMQRRMVRSNPGLFTNEVTMDVREVARLMEAVRYLSTSPAAPLREVLEKVYHIETSAAELYVITALQKSNLEMAEFLIQMGETFRVHYGFITDYTRKHGLDLEALEKGQLRQVRIPYAEDVLINGSLKVRAVDLSEGGVFLLTGRSFQQGASVRLDMPLGTLKLGVQARVQFDQQGVGMGLMFTNLTEVQQKALRHFIDLSLKSRSETGGLSKAKLLLVSNPKSEERNLRVFVSALIAGGFVVMDVKGFAEAAMVITKDHDVRMVLVDVEQQEEENLKFINFVKANPKYKDTPVVALTTSYSKELEARALGAGAARLMYKMTTTPEKLLRAVKELTGA